MRMHSRLTIILIFLLNASLINPSHAQFKDHSEVFYEIEKLQDAADAVTLVAESAIEYKKSGSLGLLLRLLQEVHVDDIKIDRATTSLASNIEQLRFKELPLKTLDRNQAFSQDVFLRRTHNVLFVDNFYTLQENYYQAQELQADGQLILKQIDALHFVLSTFRDGFGRAIDELREIGVRLRELDKFLFDRFTRYSEMAKKVANLRDPCRVKLNELNIALRNFQANSSRQLGNYVTILQDEEQLLNNRMKEYDQRQSAIRLKENEVRINGNEQGGLQLNINAEDAAWERLNNENNTLRNEITNINNEISGFRARIDELSRLEDVQKNRLCPDYNTYQNCTMHPGFVRDVEQTLRQIAVNKAGPEKEINSRMQAIGQRNAIINKNIKLMAQSRARKDALLQQLRGLQQNGMELARQLRAMKDELDKRKDWKFYQTLRNECHANKSLIANRKLFR